jgi:hypothetical protein
MKTDANNLSRAALVVAHPSHELRVHGWMQTSRPVVFILTDGSGRSGEPRLQATTKVLTDVGAQSGSIYGRLTDLDVYQAFLNGDYSLFLGFADELADEFVRLGIEYVVADAREGYSPTHDACHLLTRAAVEIANRRHHRQIANFDVAVVGPPDECPEPDRERAIWIHLDDEGFARKLDVARSYNPDLARDVEAALGGEPFKGSVFDGVELSRFRTECLRPVSRFVEPAPGRSETPFYETYGEKMVAAGHYSQTLRYTKHFKPLEEAVWRYVQSCRKVNDELLRNEFEKPATARLPPSSLETP